MRHTLKSAAHGKVQQTCGKVRQTWKSVEHLEKCDTLGKIPTYEKNRHICISAAHLEKCGSRVKMRHSWKNVSHLKKCATLKYNGTNWKFRTYARVRLT